MKPERIEELRREISALNPNTSWHRVVGLELLDALEAANAKLQRLKSSPAPVVGVVPLEIAQEVARILQGVKRYAFDTTKGEYFEIASSRARNESTGRVVGKSCDLGYVRLRFMPRRPKKNWRGETNELDWKVRDIAVRDICTVTPPSREWLRAQAAEKARLKAAIKRRFG